MRILHVALPDDWQRAVADGSYDVPTRGASLVEVGFVHACTSSQVAGVLDRFFPDVDEVTLLVIDLDRLDHEGANLVWEDVPDADDGPYPHIYGIVPTQTVVHVVPLTREPGTPWTVPDVPDVATGPAAPPDPPTEP